MTSIPRSLALLALACATAAASAGNALGLDRDVGLLSFDDVRLSGSGIRGSVLVGGNAKIASTSIQPGIGGNGLLVAGDLAFVNGSIGGSSVIGGRLISSSSGSFGGDLAVGGGLNANAGLSVAGSTTAWGSITGMQPWYPTVTPGTGAFALGFDFSGEQSRLTALSARLAQQPAASAARLQWDTLHFDVSGQSLAVFDIDAADAAKNMQIDGLASGAGVVINVHGGTVDFGNHGYTNFGAGQVLFNLADATSITFNGGVAASLLAPQATVQPGWGSIDGQVVVDSWRSSVQINGVSFDGSLPLLAAAVPEPGAAMLLLAGLGVVTLVARRRLR